MSTKNILKITHIDIDSNKSTVIFDNTTSSVTENIGDLLTGFPITEAVDGGLRTLVMHLKNCDGKNKVPNLFNPYDLISMQIGSKDESGENKVQNSLWCVANDYRSVDNPNLQTYERTITLVEPTKILDTFYIYNFNSTNKDIKLQGQVERLLRNASIRIRKDLTTLEPVCFELTDSCKEILNGVASEDFFFENVTLRECLTEMFAIANIRPVVTYAEFDPTNGDPCYTIDGESLSQVSEISNEKLLSSGDLIGDEAEASIDNYFGTMKARGYNSISKKPIKTGIRPFSTAEATLTDENITADLGFPIDDIKKFEVGGKNLQVGLVWEVAVGSGNFRSATIRTDWFVDITTAFIDNDVYMILSEEEKRKKIPYTKGESTIGMFKSYKTFLTTHSVIAELIKNQFSGGIKSDFYQYCKTNNIKDINGNTDYQNIGDVNLTITPNVSPKEMFFKSEFIPRIDTIIDITKPNVYNPNRLKMSMIDNQSARSIDISRHGKSISNLARRTGNEEIVLNLKNKDYSKLLPLAGKFTGLTGRNEYLNDYVITKREYAVYNDFINVKYYCTKNFQAINQKIGVDREKRIFAIPLEATDCPIVVKYYATVSAEKPTPIDPDIPIFNNKLILWLFYGMVYHNVIGSSKRLEYLYLDTDMAIGSDERFALPLIAYSADKTLTFAAQPLDNYSVGYGRGGYKFEWFGGGGIQMTYSKYVDSNGEFSNPKLRLASRQAVDKSLNTYPIVTTGGESSLSEEITLFYTKDRTQRPVFFFNFEFLPSKNLYGKIVIGEAFVSQNFLQSEENLPKRYLYFGTTPYYDGDTKVKGKKWGAEIVAGSYFEITNSETLNCVYMNVIQGKQSSYDYLNSENSADSKECVAIGDADGNLIIGFNTPLKRGDKFYFNVSRRLL